MFQCNFNAFYQAKILLKLSPLHQSRLYILCNWVLLPVGWFSASIGDIKDYTYTIVKIVCVP